MKNARTAASATNKVVTCCYCGIETTAGKTRRTILGLRACSAWRACELRKAAQ